MIEDLSEITDRFSRIDSKIIELLQCSSDDFLGLNTDFKALFRSSSMLSKNASDIFDILADSDTRQMMGELEELFKTLRTSHTPLINRMLEGINIAYEIQELSENLHLQVKNLNQNLLTLKFLLANLKITSPDTPEQHSPAIIEITDSYNKNINQQKIKEYHNDKNLEVLQKLINADLVKIEKYNQQLNQHFNLILDQVHTAIILFADKQQEVSRRLPMLKSLTDQISASIANIITNLQYHDIIRQKIEHVQTSHHSLLENLAKFDSQQESQQLDYLSRIRDLANIQAALLVRANKEYQRAIELITEKFRSISEDMSNISLLCKDLSQSQFNQTEIHFADLSQKLDSILVPLKGVPVMGKKLIDELTEIVKSVIQSITAQIKASAPYLEDNSLEVSVKKMDKLQKAYPQGNIVEQLREVGRDVQTTSSLIQTITQRLLGVNSRLGNICIQLAKDYGNLQDNGAMAGKIVLILDNLKRKDELIYRLLHDNFKVSKEMDTVVAGSIGQIKYYEFFEVSIIEIIKILNEIYQKIKGCTDKGEEMEEDLEFLKQLYTMESEHEIHNSIVEGGGRQPATKIDDIEEPENNEVELF